MRYLRWLKILLGHPRSRAPLGRRAARAAKKCCPSPALHRAHPSALNLGYPISKSGLHWGSCWIPKYWWPTNTLALHSQEARLHANAWVHAASSTAPQLPQQWIHLSNDGVAHSTREEQTNLLCAAQGASVQVCEINKTVPTDPLWLIAFFKQCQTALKAAGALDGKAKYSCLAD